MTELFAQSIHNRADSSFPNWNDSLFAYWAFLLRNDKPGDRFIQAGFQKGRWHTLRSIARRCVSPSVVHESPHINLRNCP